MVTISHFLQSLFCLFRKFLQNGFVTFILSDIKFLHKENADQHLWKILFYNIIELLRKGVAEGGPDGEHQKKILLQLIDQVIEC